MTFHLTCVYIISSASLVAELPPSGKKAAHSVDRMFTLYFDFL